MSNLINKARNQCNIIFIIETRHRLLISGGVHEQRRHHSRQSTHDVGGAVGVLLEPLVDDSLLLRSPSAIRRENELVELGFRFSSLRETADNRGLDRDGKSLRGLHESVGHVILSLSLGLSGRFLLGSAERDLLLRLCRAWG